MQRPVAALTLGFVAVALLAGCAPEPGGGASPSAAPAPSTPQTSATSSPTATDAPSATAEPGAIPLPSDCRAILSPAVLTQLDGVPLNDPVLAPNGPQADGSLICVWRDPRADTTGLVTRITRIGEGDALDQLNALADGEGFTCYKPDAGTRCEKTFPNPTYPVTDGRTLYYRSGVLIDTRFSNLAPDGYTSSIVAAIFPPSTATPTPTPTPGT